MVAGYSKERVIHAPGSGTFQPEKAIGDLVAKGDVLGFLYAGSYSGDSIHAGTFTGDDPGRLPGDQRIEDHGYRTSYRGERPLFPDLG